MNDKVKTSAFEARLGQLESMVGQFISASHPESMAYTVRDLLSMSEAARGEVMAAAAEQRRREAAGEAIRKRGAAVDFPPGYEPSALQMLRMSFKEDGNDQLQRFTNTGKKIG